MLRLPICKGRLIVTQILWSSNGRLDHLLFFDTGSPIHSVYGMDQLRQCECGRCGTNKELQGHKKWSCRSGSWTLPWNTEFCVCLCQRAELLWDASIVLGNGWPMSTEPFCPVPLPRTRLPGHRPQAWNIMQAVMFNSQLCQIESYSNSLKATLTECVLILFPPYNACNMRWLCIYFKL